MTSNKQIDILWKAVNKQGKYIEELEVIISHLKKDSHPPVFKESQYIDLNDRLQLVEAWIENIKLIEKGELN
tara:strand:- start:83 stop:298 length:216 start_codon:yes stop_codon:yes gene_type:complete